MSKPGPYPHEKRVQRYAYFALAAAAALSIWLILLGGGEVLRVKLPLWVPFLALAAGAVTMGIAISRRSDLLSGIGAALLALATLPAGPALPGFLGYAIGLLFGAALLLTIELIHMTERYERAHRAVDAGNVPEEHINRVTDEALATLFTRASFALAGGALVVGLAYLLRAIGPAQWRAAIETTAPVGVALLAITMAGAASLYILARAADYRLRRPSPSKETLPDVAE